LNRKEEVESYRAAWDRLRKRLETLAAEEALSVDEVERMTRILERLLKAELLVDNMARNDPDRAAEVDITIEGVD
jgi:hypothetical protein